MKRFIKLFFIFIIAQLCITLQADAQQLNTSESIGSQLKNNRQPGLKYAPGSKAYQPNVSVVAGSTISKNGVADKKAGLASEQSAAEARKIAPPAKVIQPPTQEEKLKGQK